MKSLLTNYFQSWLPALLVLTPFIMSAQNIIADMDHDAHRAYDRLHVLSGGRFTSLHTAVKPFWRQDLVALADTMIGSMAVSGDLDNRQWSILQKIYDQNNEFTHPSWDTINHIVSPVTNLFAIRYRQSEKSLWNTFYKTPAHFHEVNVRDFYLRINPILQIAVGRESNEDVTTFINQRGISIRGGIGRNVFFHTSLYDSQVRYPNYINTFTDTFGVVPGVGLYKPFTSKFFDFTKGRDFLLATAYVGVNFGKYLGAQLGHNQSFIGEGIRSLLLSDFSTPFFSLKLNTRIWKFHYQNIFAELAADSFLSVDGLSEPVAKKYMAAHYLDFKPSPHVSIGLYEAVVFDRADHQFELQYLNPIILYRTIEGSLGSPDNVLLGLNARVDAWKQFTFYGQFMLDDIIISTILDGQLDWWGNKYGYQLGAKYLNVLSINHLDAQVEWNSVRPYTYSHYDSDSNYSHYKQSLAHPIGSNFNELILSASYTFNPRLSLKSSLHLIEHGEDADSVSFGGDILVPNTQRPGDFGHSIGQGVATDIFIWNTTIHYELFDGFFLDGLVLLRKKDSAVDLRDLDTQLIQIGLRYNLARRQDLF